MSRRLRVALLFGGRSGEHEVSLASARAVYRALDQSRYEVVGIGITKQGRWLTAPSVPQLMAQEVSEALPDVTAVSPLLQGNDMVLASDSTGEFQAAPIDVVIPLLHGPYGEDGTVQGFLELAGVPYIGSGVTGSAVSMDKAMMKSVFAAARLPQVSYRLVLRSEWRRRFPALLSELTAALTFPMFVKPCNLGSSVGISKASDVEELEHAVNVACEYDARIIVEQGVEAREIECGVLGNEDPLVSVPGEIVSGHEFYDYEAKYTEGLSSLKIPASVTREQAAAASELARRAFKAVDASGLARVDFFVRKEDGAVLVNEINTIPGFTETSMYPKLWEASGVPFPELIDRLIELGIQRFNERSNNSTEHRARQRATIGGEQQM